MPANKDTLHAFDYQLASVIGIEKALLVGNFQHWINHNETRQSAEHFHLGEYWTHWTAKELAGKYPYLKASSIYRWLDQLEADGWIKTGRFNDKNTDQRKWYGRGNRLLDWEKSPIYQTDNSNSQNGKSKSDNGSNQPIYHFENSASREESPIYQNDNANYQNDKCIYKDTHINSHLSTTTTTRGESKSAGGEEVDLPASKLPPNPDSAAPLSPAELPKRIYGDGELHQQVRQYYRENPDQFPGAMYPEFLEHWTALVQRSEKAADLGKELWRTKAVFPLEKKLKNWLKGYQHDQTNHGTSTQLNPSRTSGQPAAKGRTNSHATKRVAYLTDDD